MSRSFSEGAHRNSVPYSAIGCVVALLLGVLVLLAAGRFLFGVGDTTRYAKGFTEAKFESIKVGMTDKQVRSVLGEPLSICQDIVLTKRLQQNGCEKEYCSFVDGRQVSGSMLLTARAGAWGVSSIQKAMSLLTPEERKAARIQYEWDYAEPGALLSQHYQIRDITFSDSGLVIDKYSGEWVD